MLRRALLAVLSLNPARNAFRGRPQVSEIQYFSQPPKKSNRRYSPAPYRRPCSTVPKTMVGTTCGAHGGVTMRCM